MLIRLIEGLGKELQRCITSKGIHMGYTHLVSRWYFLTTNCRAARQVDEADELSGPISMHPNQVLQVEEGGI